MLVLVFLFPLLFLFLFLFPFLFLPVPAPEAPPDAGNLQKSLELYGASLHVDKDNLDRPWPLGLLFSPLEFSSGKSSENGSKWTAHHV